MNTPLVAFSTNEYEEPPLSVSGATVVDGTITTSGSGRIHPPGSTFTNVTNTGMVENTDNQVAAVTGTLTNNGTWSLSSIGSNTDLYCPGGATFGGTGTVLMGKLTAKAEYLYADLGNMNCSAAACGIATNVDLRPSILRAGLNYRF